MSIPPEKTHKGIVLNLGQRFIKSCGRVFFFLFSFFLTGARWEGGGGRYGSETERPDIHKPHDTINPPVDSCLLLSVWGSLCDKGSGNIMLLWRYSNANEVFYLFFFLKVRHRSGSPRRWDRLNHVLYFLSPQAFIPMSFFSSSFFSRLPPLFWSGMSRGSLFAPYMATVIRGTVFFACESHMQTQLSCDSNGRFCFSSLPFPSCDDTNSRSQTTRWVLSKGSIAV